ncbi:hypothetical protein BD779DRAFT_1671330 [Infundibulicybe gibba]|nr:hypothetical protein BD779DRAFT_1671330 [Infundibulicybe gibba]
MNTGYAQDFDPFADARENRSGLELPGHGLFPGADSNRLQLPQSVENLELSDLMKNSHVQTMYSQMIRASKVNEEQYQEIKMLRSEVHTLQAEVTAFKSNSRLTAQCFLSAMRADSVAPSDSASQVNKCGGPQNPISPIDSTGGMELQLPELGTQPSIRPSKYSDTILWTIDDTHTDPMNLVSEGNPCRPKIDKCIRDANGVPVSLAQWRAIRKTAYSIFAQVFPRKRFPTP